MGKLLEVVVDALDELPPPPVIVELPETVLLPDAVAFADADGAGVIVNTIVCVAVLSTRLGPNVTPTEKEVESWTG